MDPVRLLDQPDLPAHEREVLEAGRREPPVAYDVASGAARLGKSLSGAGASGSMATSSIAAKLGLKLFVVAVLTSVAFFASLQMTTPHTSQRGAESTPVAPVVHAPPAQAPAVTVAAPEQPVTPAPAAPADAPAQQRVAPRAIRKVERDVAIEAAGSDVAQASGRDAVRVQEEVEAQPEPSAEAADERPQAIERPEQSERTAEPAPSPAMLEMKAIADAKRALSEQAPERALAILAAAARDFPRGYFIEERRALRVLALADRGESEQARREAASFARDYPSGAFTARVKAAAGR